MFWRQMSEMYGDYGLSNENHRFFIMTWGAEKTLTDSYSDFWSRPYRFNKNSIDYLW